MLEREVKLAADASFELSGLEGLDEMLDLPDADAPTAREIQDIYFDTDTFRLARWGVTLRHRRGEGWTVKLPAKALHGAMARREVLVEGAPGNPPAPALDLVSSFTLGEAVHEVARFDTSRLVRTWRSDKDVGLFEICVDDVVAQVCSGGEVSFREVEVELAPGADEGLLETVVDRLIATGARRGEQIPKLVRVLGDAAAAPSDVVEPRLGERPTAREVIQATIARSVVSMLRSLPAARLGEDPEGVHQSRVATRRLRSDIRTFGPLLEASWASGLLGELRWLADELGQVRDGDVLSARLREVVERTPAIDAEAAERVMAVLELQRSDARSTLLGHLGDDRAFRLFEHLVAAAADPVTAPQADDPAAERLPALVRRPWVRLHRAVEALGEEPVVDRLHEVRILAKRTKYAAEAVASAFGKEASSFAKAVAGIQDVLGELNDAAVAEAWLTDAARTIDSEAAFAAGRMAQVFATEGDRYRHGWERAYERASRKQLTTWFR